MKLVLLWTNNTRLCLKDAGKKYDLYNHKLSDKSTKKPRKVSEICSCEGRDQHTVSTNSKTLRANSTEFRLHFDIDVYQFQKNFTPSPLRLHFRQDYSHFIFILIFAPTSTTATRQRALTSCGPWHDVKYIQSGIKTAVAVRRTDDHSRIFRLEILISYAYVDHANHFHQISGRVALSQRDARDLLVLPVVQHCLDSTFKRYHTTKTCPLLGSKFHHYCDPTTMNAGQRT